MKEKDAYYAECDALVKRMNSEGRPEDILAGLTHKGALIRINGIINAVCYSFKTPETVSLIKNLKNDNITFDTYSVSDFAIAALDIMGVEKYNGNRKQIVDLIGSRFDFK
ncbi:MAG: hypothetical protein LUC47_09105 [Clostridiales bacterium]|nr:hypothetical protein [Clostridiales bacterium]